MKFFSAVLIALLLVTPTWADDTSVAKSVAKLKSDLKQERPQQNLVSEALKDRTESSDRIETKGMALSMLKGFQAVT